MAIDSELVVDTVTASTGLPLAPPPPQASSSLTFNYNLPPYTPILAQLSDPTFILPFFGFLVLQPIFYQAVIFFFPKRFATPKQRAWILTALSSFVMTVASIPYVWNFLAHPEPLNTAPCMTWTVTAKVLCAFFVSYCLGDLAVGHWLYPTEINPWSGYFHHSLYTFMVTNLVQRGLPSAFVIVGILEAPTFLMSLGSIHKPLRNDKLFGAVFFLTRLVFHIYLTLHAALSAYPWTSVFMYPASVLPLHVMWFHGWVKQQRRLRKAKLSSPESTTKSLATPVSSTLPSPPSKRKDVTSNDRLTARHKRPQRPSASTSIDAGRRSSVSGLKPIDMTESGNAIS